MEYGSKFIYFLLVARQALYQYQALQMFNPKHKNIVQKGGKYIPRIQLVLNKSNNDSVRMISEREMGESSHNHFS